MLSVTGAKDQIKIATRELFTDMTHRKPSPRSQFLTSLAPGQRETFTTASPMINLRMNRQERESRVAQAEEVEKKQNAARGTLTVEQRALYDAWKRKPVRAPGESAR